MKVIYSLFMILFLSATAVAGPYHSRSGPEPSQLAKDPRFRLFAYNFLEHFRQWSSLYKLEKPTAITEAIQNSDGEEETVAGIYSEFGIDFEEAMLRQNAIDNDFYTLMVDFPAFQEVDDEETSRTIVEALKIVSKDAPSELEVHKAMPPDENPRGAGLTVEEVWDCMLEALGVGVGSLISIHALKKLAAEEGVQAVLVKTTKFLVKKAGWVGAIATLVDFGMCINSERLD